MANLTADQMGQLADNYQALADQLLQYKLKNAATLTPLQVQDLSSRITLILHNANLMAALSTVQAVQDLTPQLDSLKQATTSIGNALNTIATVQKVIDIATTIVDLGTSVLSGNIDGIVGNIGSLAADVGV